MAVGSAGSSSSSSSTTSSSSSSTSDRVSVSALERAFSALVGYTAGAAVVLPFDRVKSLLQVSEASRRQGALAVARQIFRTQGLAGLYQGGAAHMLIAPYTVFYCASSLAPDPSPSGFRPLAAGLLATHVANPAADGSRLASADSTYDEILGHGRRATTDAHGPAGHPLLPLFAATLARSVETAARQPLELVRTISQTSDAAVTTRDIVGTLFRQPLHCWFRGLMPTLLRDVPFSATYWLFYETSKRHVRVDALAVGGATAATFVQSLVCGAVSGMAAAVLVAPLDVIKTVRQHRLESGHAADYADILRSIRNAPVVAFAGLGPRLVRIPCALDLT
jgi:hypothetical protein